MNRPGRTRTYSPRFWSALPATPALKGSLIFKDLARSEQRRRRWTTPALALILALGGAARCIPCRNISSLRLPNSLVGRQHTPCDHPPALLPHRRHRGCLVDVQRDILGGPIHEGRSLLWATGLGRLHGSSKGRALNMR